MSQFLPKISRYIPLTQRRIPAYPLYLKNDPQLRVFLPLFWMKMIKHENPHPNNYAFFHVHLQMTKNDVRQYLEKIYNVKTVAVRFKIIRGKDVENGGTKYMEEDNIKEAMILCEQDFTFPNIFPRKLPSDKQYETIEEFKKLKPDENESKISKWFC
ncbi:hypothetical protein A3Q56_05942 [Intoshia linei]|uniref:Large ribosomal subunit protein uL23m n=1 Tax=Intoshia linei TaxID=1819745 RepID=A0A177AWD1_9BILA|nr:hypothetical protein A3Q56_05942 [Intoshia linei]